MIRSSMFLVSTVLLAAGAAAEGLAEWPPRDYLLRSLVQRVPAILKSYHADTGKFGTEPWICGDQNPIFPLAAAWSIEHPDNPYYHSAEVLAAIAGGGVVLVNEQDEAGRWRFDKKDGSYWGQIHMPWTYSRWIRAYLLVGDALPAEARETWERGLNLGFGHIARAYPESTVHNIPVHLAMSLYLAGVALENEDWQRRAREFMPKVVAAQDATGFWSEHQGPVVAYNYVYSDSLGIYYHFAKDPVVLEALRRAAYFHSAILWPDGSSVSCIDERNLYSSSVRIGNPGFAHTPEGRGYLLAQLRRHAGEGERNMDADMAAALLLYGGEGEIVMPGEIGEDGVVILGDNDTLIRRGDAWSWALSAYTADVPNNRWIQDRHNLVDLFHGELGLVAGGGNTKMQPLWSTFTMGDVSQLRLTPETENPDFTPDIDLVWTSSQSTVRREGDAARLEVTLNPRTRLKREVLLSEDFEGVAPDGLPAGWRVFGRKGETDAIAATDDQCHDGKQSLFFRNGDNRNSLGLRSPQVPVAPGESCVAEVWWRGETGQGASFYLEFWDAAGQRLQEGMRIVACPGQEDWIRRSAAGRVPEGAVGVTVLLYSSIAATAAGHFDDVVIARLVPDEQEGKTARCSVEVRPDGDELVLTYRATPGQGVRAHLPLMLRGSRLELATGKRLPLVEDQIELASGDVGGSFALSGLRVTMPEGASLVWPARHFNPYTKDGRSTLNSAKLVLAMPFTDTGEYTVRLAASKPEPFAGLVFEARDLPFTHAEGTYTKRLDNLGSQFIGSTKPGDWLRFTLPDIKPGRYELIGDFVVAYSYGIVEILLDGKEVGEPFDGYWAAVDSSGTQQSFGEVTLGGQHEVTVRIVGKNPAATNQIFSVKRWLLRPLE